MGPIEVNNTNNAREAKYPPFKEFCPFLKREARIACNPINSLQATKEDDWKGNRDKWKPNSKFQRTKIAKIIVDSEVSQQAQTKPRKEDRETERRTKLKG